MAKEKKNKSKTDKIGHKKKALIEALTKTLGIVTTACKEVGIARDTFYTYVKNDSEFAEAVKDIENIAFDFVESKLYQQIKNDNIAAIIFYAKTKMKSRGYIEKSIMDIAIENKLPDLKKLNEKELNQLAELTAKLGSPGGDNEA